MFSLKSRRLLVCLLLLIAGPLGLWAQSPPLASGQLEIRGNRLTLYADAASSVTDAEQTINIGERAAVRTCFGGPTVPCGSLVAGDPRIAGLLVEAELSGPELPEPLPLTTVPGGTFVLPGFQQEGEYSLENIRLVGAETGQVIALAEPSLAILHVRQIVLTSATVRQLSLEELRARGIELTEENFQAFDFAVGFAFGSQVVEINFPVTFEGQSTVGGVAKPQVNLDDLPPGIVDEVARWKPPTIVPFRLAPSEGLAAEQLDIGREEVEVLEFPVYGVIVLPGTVTYLNQFFEASLLVANGAPANSQAALQNLRAAIRLPAGNALRLARTEPPVTPGQDVPVLAENGGQTLFPSEQGKASWTVEGLKPGTHSIFMDLQADLVRPGRDPLPLSSRSQAAVEVVDARFHLTFSHPDVVREGEAYTLYVTVANESLATQNLVSVLLKRLNLSGAHPADDNDDLLRQIESLRPGESETLEFDLVSDITGQVVATTFQAESSSGLGTIELRAGVGELGIPLSPATLVLPRYSEHLKALAGPELLRANNRLLGLAHSLSVASASALPRELTSISKIDVERRALDIGEAGQRIFLGEELLATSEVLALDQLGNRHRLESYDRLRRLVSKGLRAGGELAKVLRSEQDRLGLSGEELFEHFAGTTSYTRPFLAVAAIPRDAGGALDLEIRGLAHAEGSAAYANEDESRARRTLPWADIFAIRSESNQAEPLASLGLVGRFEANQAFTVEISNPLGVQVNARLLLMVPDLAGGGFLEVDFGIVSLAAGEHLALDVDGSLDLRLYDPATGVERSGAPAIGTIPLPPFRILGIRQEFGLIETFDALGNLYKPNRYGHGLTYLFNRPPSAEIVRHPEAWRIVSTFEGLDTLGNAVSGMTDKMGDAVFIQDSERVVNVLYSSAISPLFSEVDLTTPLVEHAHDLDTREIVDAGGEQVSSQLPSIQLEKAPLHRGGLVAGRVVRGSGEVVVGAKVELIRQREFMVADGIVLKLDPVAESITGADGRYFFDFVEQSIPEPQIRRTFLVRATVPAGEDPVTEPAAVEEVGSIIRLNNRVSIVNIALLGRGAVYGHLKYADTQQPVPLGKVEAASTLFNDFKKTQVDENGFFRIEAVPVGPITLTGRDAQGRAVYATIEVAQSGSEVEVELRLPRPPPPGLGTVRGRVLLLRGSKTVPASGARIACYTAGQLFASKVVGEDGSFVFANVPAGQVTLQAADFRVSRTSVVQDELLPVGGTVEAELRIPESFPKSITGRVLLRDIATNALSPAVGVVVFVPGPGNFAYTGADGSYLIEGVPTQAAGEIPYSLKALDVANGLQAEVVLPRILESTPDPILAPDMEFRIGQSVGAVRGVVLDPFGQPAGNVDLVLYPLREGVKTEADGSFVFEDVRVGDYEVVAHVGDGLESGSVGYFGKTAAHVSYPGHQPFVTVPMVGAGTVRLITRTSTATGILTPIYYRPTYYSQAEKNIILRGQYFESTTDPNGRLELDLPVGPFEIVAYNPFHGTKTIHGEIVQPGQVVDYEIIFEDAGKVGGQVVGPDGVTPIPFAEVVMRTGAFLPQSQQADASGRFEFFLVPKGPVVLEARGLDGAVERVGSTLTYITLGGQEIDVSVVLKAQGTVRGRVVEILSGATSPVAFAQYAVYENSFPFRRFPEDGSYYVADAGGEYEVSHLYVGPITVTARDPLQPERSARVKASLVADWQRLQMPDIEFSGGLEVGTVSILVRDPVSGAPVPDAQVKLSNGEMTVSGADGRAIFESLRVGTYGAYVFYAPSGRSARVSNLTLSFGGSIVEGTANLDQRGEVRGTVWDSAALTTPIPGAVVELRGETAGGRLVALATASTDAAQLGRFEFLGIPESDFTLTAAEQTTPRRGKLTASITATSPEVDVNIVLEPLRSVYFRLYESLIAGVFPVDTTAGLFSMRLRQPASSLGNAYDFTRLETEPNGTYFFPDLLLDRHVDINALELTGDQRSASLSLSNLSAPPSSLPGAGTTGDPFRLTLAPRGTLRVTVLFSNGNVAPGITVRLGGSSLATDGDGVATFVAVKAGNWTVSAYNPVVQQSGYASGTLTYDDQVLDLTITLASALSATGIIHQPTPGDRQVPEGQLVPMEGAVVEFTDGGNRKQVQLTDASGRYRFDALRSGNYSLIARNNNGDWEVSKNGSLQGTDGTLIDLGFLVLDASPPRLLEITPATGASGVSRATVVEITFSELLNTLVLPSGSSSPYFAVKLGNQLVPGTWTYRVNSLGQHVVRFQPSELLANFTQYSIVITGGTNGVRDRQNRPLTTASSVGSSFRTSDTVGPTIVETVPRLDRAVDPAVALRFDFSEKVFATDELLDGDGFEDAATLEAQRLDGSWVELPLVLYLTRYDFSLQVERLVGVGLPAEQDSLRRRLRISGLADSLGNEMEPALYLFRIYDENPPIFTLLPPPANAPDGNLLISNAYSLIPQLAGLEDVTPENPGGDLDRVEFYYNDPDDPEAQPSIATTATSYPFAFSFTAAYFGNGVDPRPFPIWARAFDTSQNASEARFVDLRVLPNRPPVAGVVTIEKYQGGTLYVGGQVVVRVQQYSDPDGGNVSLTLRVRRADTGADIGTALTYSVKRPAAGWTAAPEYTLSLGLPADIPAGTPVIGVVEARDSQGSLDVAESSPLTIETDNVPPTLSSPQMLDSRDRPATSFEIGQSVRAEIDARDFESGLKNMSVTFDRTDLFGSEPYACTSSNSSYYRSARIVITAQISGPVEVVATFEGEDFQGNTSTITKSFLVKPSTDDVPPTVHWSSPWPSAAWPANYASVVGQPFVPLLLRFDAIDQSRNSAGELVSGQLVRVELRLPVQNPDGSFSLSETWQAAELLAGSESPGQGTYQALFSVPNNLPPGTLIPFEARALDTGGQATTATANLVAVAARRVYEGVRVAIDETDPMQDAAGDPSGPIFLLDGSELSLFPQIDGSLRQVPALYLYAGGYRNASNVLVVEPSILTTPEITSIASTVKYRPLELEIGSFFGLGAGCLVDLEGRGLYGGRVGSGIVEMTLPGVRGAEPGAGGSHGGSGLPGRLRSYQRTRPGAVYDSVRAPRLPGGGGRSESSSLLGTSGGGVVRIEGASAEIRLEGSILARGQASTNANSPSGAGGSLEIVAGQLSGRGLLDVSGGAKSSGWDLGVGGGGRMAIYYRQLASEVDATRQFLAGGGSGTPPGGAGTIYLEELGSAGQKTGLGHLRVGNVSHSGTVAGLTLLPGVGAGGVLAVDSTSSSLILDLEETSGEVVGERIVVAQSGVDLATFEITFAEGVQEDGSQRVRLEVSASSQELADLAAALASGPELRFRGLARYLDITLSGDARLVADGDVELGPADASSINDRSLIFMDADAALLLRGDGPTLAPEFPAQPGQAFLGNSIAVPTWTATDLFGLELMRYGWVGQAEKVQTYNNLTGTRTPSLAQDPLPIPLTATPGTLVEYRVELADFAGRQSEFSRTWLVQENQLPTIELLNSSLPTVTPGSTVNLSVRYTDVEGLVSASLVGGNTVELSGTLATYVWPYKVPLDAAPGSIAEAVLTVTDNLGATGELVVPIRLAAGTPPSGFIEFYQAGLSSILAGEYFRVVLHASDEGRDLRTVGLDTTGPIALPTSYSHNLNTSFDYQETFLFRVSADAQPGDILVISGYAIDSFGSRTDFAPIQLVVIADTFPPESNLPTAPKTYYADQSIEIQNQIYDHSPLALIESTFNGETSIQEEPQYPYVFAFTVPRDLNAPVITSVRQRIVDIWGNETIDESGPITLRPDEPPTMTLELEPSAGADPGQPLLVRLQAVDDGGLDFGTIDVSIGAVSAHLDGIFGREGGPAAVAGPIPGAIVARVYEPGERYPLQGSLEVSLVLPPEAQLGDPIFVQTTVTDGWGHLVAQNFTIPVGRQAAPELGIYLNPAADRDTYESGTSLTLVATASDPNLVSAQLTTPAGITAGRGLIESQWTLPAVSQPTEMEVQLEAVNGGGRRSELRRTITVLPATGDATQAFFDCPSAGALLPSGDVFDFHLRAESALGIAGLELFAAGDAEPLWSADAAGATSFSALAAVDLGTAGIKTYLLRTTDMSGQITESSLEIQVADAVELNAAGGNDWNALASEVAVLRSGVLSLDQPVVLAGLIVMPGASLTHPPFVGTEKVQIEVSGPVYIACGGSIDATGRGYAANKSFLGSGSTYAGNHIGRRADLTTAGLTYGSVFNPLEAGAGAYFRGGGIVRVAAERLVVDGGIHADGELTAAAPYSAAGGAGGSVWLTSETTVGGSGTISASGATAKDGAVSGGGGAISIEASSLTPELAARVSAFGGSGAKPGGPGSFYFRPTGEELGDLRIVGVSQTNSSLPLPTIEIEGFEDVYITDAGTIDPVTQEVWVSLYGLRSTMVGRDLEVSRQYSGAVDRFLIVAMDGSLVLLRPRLGSNSLDLPGNGARILFDVRDLRLQGDFELFPIRGLEKLRHIRVEGRPEIYELKAESLELAPGSWLGHKLNPNLSTQDALGVLLEVDDLLLWPGSSIDVSERGYRGGNSTAGGSHLGVGGRNTVAIDEIPEHPKKMGGSGTKRGGGLVEIASKVTYVPATASIRADGGSASNGSGGAGGSVRIEAEQELFLGGEVSAAGGDTQYFAAGAGGGGAISIVYGEFTGSLDSLRAWGGRATNAADRGGAGAIALRQVGQPAADLRIDNGSVPTQKPTVFSNLGSGEVDFVLFPAPEGGGEGGGGGGGGGEGGGFAGSPEGVFSALAPRSESTGTPWTTICFDTVIYDHSLGRWVELWREDYMGNVSPRRGHQVIAGVTPGSGQWQDNTWQRCGEFEVPPGEIAEETFDVTNWQGVYYFRNVFIRNGLLDTVDLIRSQGDWTLEGDVAVDVIEGRSLTLGAGTLSSWSEADGEFFSSFLVKLSGDLNFEAGAKIDLSEKGLLDPPYWVTGARNSAGATHFGVGGAQNASDRGEAYGSLTRPREPGSGRSGRRGGGSLVIDVQGDVVFAGEGNAILANGQKTTSGASSSAGGSVYIRAANILGAAAIEAKGGDGNTSVGGGGGGAISLEYDSVDSALLDQLSAAGGSATRPGGAGSIYLFERGVSNTGDLILDNSSRSGLTRFPSVGNGPLLEFYGAGIDGHFIRGERSGVEIARWRLERDSSGFGTIANLLFGDPETFLSGDTWQGVYYFDTLTVGPGVSYETEAPYDLIIPDQLIFRSLQVGGAREAEVAVDRAEPQIDLSQIRIEGSAASGVYRIVLPPAAWPGSADAVVHLEGAKNPRLSTLWSSEGVVFLWPGDAGEALRISLETSSGAPLAAAALPPLPAIDAVAGKLRLSGKLWLIDSAVEQEAVYFLIDTGENLLEVWRLDRATFEVETLFSLPRLHEDYRFGSLLGGIEIVASGSVDALANASFFFAAGATEPQIRSTLSIKSLPGCLADFIPLNLSSGSASGMGEP